jgi:hypothetical protein
MIVIMIIILVLESMERNDQNCLKQEAEVREGRNISE